MSESDGSKLVKAVQESWPETTSEKVQKYLRGLTLDGLVDKMKANGTT